MARASAVEASLGDKHVDVGLPAIRSRQLRVFTAYVGFYLRRHFHGIHLLRLTDPKSLDGWPLLICLNHPSWWDPLIALYLSQKFFPGRKHYAPIAEQGLAKYRFFEKLGFFGIQPGTRGGAARFLRFGTAVLRSESGALWVTAQGEFTDVRRRPVELQPGVAHLAHQTGRLAVLPIALEYAFWQERTAEAFACLGIPIFISNGAGCGPGEWLRTFRDALQSTQDVLSEHVIARDVKRFEPMLTGSAGVGGAYDIWRALKSLVRGRSFHAQHDSK